MPVDNRRAHDRVAAGSLTATVKEAGGLFNKLKKSHACVVLDLSREGAGVLSATGFDPMSDVVLTLETPDGLRVQLGGRVRFTNPVDAQHYRVGIHFHTPGPEGNAPEALETLRKIEAQLAGRIDA